MFVSIYGVDRSTFTPINKLRGKECQVFALCTLTLLLYFIIGKT